MDRFGFFASFQDFLLFIALVIIAAFLVILPVIIRKALTKEKTIIPESLPAGGLNIPISISKIKGYNLTAVDYFFSFLSPSHAGADVMGGTGIFNPELLLFQDKIVCVAGGKIEKKYNEIETALFSDKKTRFRNNIELFFHGTSESFSARIESEETKMNLRSFLERKGVKTGTLQ